MYNRRQFVGTLSTLIGSAPLLGHSAFASAAPTAVTPRRIIIDTDPGVDDAFALMMAMRTPELHIDAVTAVAGNIPLSVTSGNALKLVSLCGRSDIPVAAGAASPLQRRLQVAAYVHGDNGLVGVELPPPSIKLAEQNAIDLIGRIVGSAPGQITIVALGPLTNIALALRTYPKLATQIPSIVLMGGGLNRGNMSPSAEFNFYVDPEAASIVFESGIPITMVGLNVTERITVTDEQVGKLRSAGSPVSRAAAEIAGRVLDNAQKRSGRREFHTHDPLALSVLLDPAVVTLEDFYVKIETSGELTAGESLCYRRSPMRSSAPLLTAREVPVSNDSFRPNAKVAVDVNTGLFSSLLLDRLAH